jgi:beta-ureidopropionase / N-carbamoyl-L-amino-acid hydrolase
MDQALCAKLTKACEAGGAAHALLPSGAGHDASLFANAGIPSGMLFVRNEHGSHNPREAMDIGDFMLGVGALADTLEQLA